MNIYKMEVNKKVINPVTKEGEYQKIGTVEIPVFSLSEFDVPATPLTGAERAAALTAAGVTAEADDGLDVFSNPKIQFVYDAMVAATKADARNKLVQGSVTLKAGNKIASTVEELIAKAERSGAALALAREFLTSFAAYLSTKSGKSATVQALYNSMVKVRQSITLSSQARKDGLMNQLEGYTAQASTEDVGKFQNIIATLGDLCTDADVVEVEDSDL